MKRFSERFGYAAAKVSLKISDMPDSLRNGLWDVAREFYFDDISNTKVYSLATYNERFRSLSRSLEFHFFKRPIDSMDRDPHFQRDRYRKHFFECKFYEVYDLLEAIPRLENGSKATANRFRSLCNSVFERELAAVRFVGSTIGPIISEEEIDAVEEAMNENPADSVRTHVKRATELFAQRPKPDYRNSMKESISAVEAAVRIVTGGKGVGVSSALRRFEGEISVHPAMISGFEKLYAYTSDEGGVRHSLLDEEKVGEAEAKYMLISCSAFSNFLLSKKANVVNSSETHFE